MVEDLNQYVIDLGLPLLLLNTPNMPLVSSFIKMGLADFENRKIM